MKILGAGVSHGKNVQKSLKFFMPSLGSALDGCCWRFLCTGRPPAILFGLFQSLQWMIALLFKRLNVSTPMS